MDKYCQEIDITDSESTHIKLINLTGKGKKVLEIGCANGRMSKYLVQNGCEVTGVEVDAIKAQIAKQFCKEV
ncbi:MAG: methyltransferase domain-containing protein, partial [Candidatus Omnitrophota bacterium]